MVVDDRVENRVPGVIVPGGAPPRAVDDEHVPVGESDHVTHHPPQRHALHRPLWFRVRDPHPPARAQRAHELPPLRSRKRAFWCTTTHQHLRCYISAFRLLQWQKHCRSCARVTPAGQNIQHFVSTQITFNLLLYISNSYQI
ncbi:unnamed protein product [Cuscuta europaea]|uniref:Uncharacterized protein n=1 Tax=Cuscuta europaea TaxID=41803 RepID=A0A9P1ENZ0_CUSEU|nr:unnamed protein product [Cuscuta europaea]